MYGDAEVMRTPPIFYAVAQIMFNPIMSMDQYVDMIQNRWRVRFPDFSKEMVNQFELQLEGDGGLPKLKTVCGERWSFKDVEGKTGYLLTNHALALQTTQYTNSKEFITLLIEGLSALHEIVSLSYIDGVGFRTLDAIIPSQEKLLSEYLSSGLQGLFPEMDGELVQSIYQLTMKRVFGQLTTRTIILNSQIGIPADLAPIRLSFREEVSNLNGLHAVLDNDVTHHDRFPYSAIEAARRLRIIKEGLNESFYKSLTKEAILEWREN
jgi:uncharacterized protein (TIGR04255 family)